MGETHAGRTILRIGGTDREHFLQGLVTNDVRGLDRIAYAALLTPQGKFIADFFLVPRGRRDPRRRRFGAGDEPAAEVEYV